VSNSKSISANVENIVLNLSNRLQINGFANQSEILLNSLSISTDGSKSVLIKIIKNPTTIGANTTTDYSNLTYYNESQSLILYDTTADTYTGGSIVFQFILPKVDARIIDLTPLALFIARDEEIIITAGNAIFLIVYLA
jgi:hypothetical protein